jgi:phage regulator Rha-like protein
MQLQVSTALIEQRIYLIRGQKVMLDRDLAALYQVQTKNLNKAVKRNLDRFPGDFMFRVAPEEIESLRFQIGTSNTSRGGRRYLPYVFSEQGVAMLSSVLNSKRAVQMNIAIIRVFIKLREAAISQKDLSRRIDSLEHKYQNHDQEIKAVFDAIRRLISTPAPSKHKIGFASGNS